MAYSVKEIYYTIQGEGAQVGRPAVFCRFSGCNLWSGREEDRINAICNFCDTDFVGATGVCGGNFNHSEALASVVDNNWISQFANKKFVVCTGGEPLLQLDAKLIARLHERGFEIAVETNGTLLPPEDLDWICVSPKAGTDLKLRKGNELKLVFPQPTISPKMFESLEFDHLFLQPMDGDSFSDNLAATIKYVLAHPWWRLSLQTQKFIGME